MTSHSDTPRTNSRVVTTIIGADNEPHQCQREYVTAAFARTLEGEVDKYQKIAIERGTQLIDANARISALTAQLAEARRDEAIKWAQSFEKEAEAYLATGFSDDHYVVAVRKELARRMRMEFADSAAIQESKK